MPKNTLKTTIWSTSPFAIASITDSGTTCRRIWSHVCALAVISDSCPIGRLTPTPGFVMFTATSPMTSASVVTISK